MTESVLSCQAVCKRFTESGHTIDVLKDLNLVVEKGESIAIQGASGSGKTTLMNLLGGLDQPSSGKILVKGQDISTLESKVLDNLRNQFLGFVYQFHHLLSEFSALENAAMPLIIRGEDFDLCLQKSRELLSMVGLQDRLDHKPAKLSGGERQRVAIARALINQPECVLMDEPTGNLDENTAHSIRNLLQDLQNQFDTSFVIVTHDPQFARSMDRILKLENGALSQI